MTTRFAALPDGTSILPGPGQPQRLNVGQDHRRVAQSPVECIIDDAEPAIEPSPAIGRAAAPPVASPLHHHLGEAQVVMQLVVVVKLNIWLRQATVVLSGLCLRGSAIRTGGAGQFAPLGARRPSWSGGVLIRLLLSMVDGSTA